MNALVQGNVPSYQIKAEVRQTFFVYKLWFRRGLNKSIQYPCYSSRYLFNRVLLFALFPRGTVIPRHSQTQRSRIRLFVNSILCKHTRKLFAAKQTEIAKFFQPDDK